MNLEYILRQIESDRDNLRHDRSPLWIVADPPWHIDAVGGRLHHQSPILTKECQVLAKDAAYILDLRENWVSEERAELTRILNANSRADPTSERPDA